MERTNQSVPEPVGWCEMNETGDRCGPAVRAAYRVQKLGNFTCAGIARRCCGPRCPHKAGIYGRLARGHSRGKPTSTPTLTPGGIWMQAHKSA